jgi:cysteinyl-tRNA synthetase
MLDLIGALIERDAAYAVEGDVYFRVRSDEAYGSLSHRQLEQMDQGEGIEGASLKEDPLDFALWKAQKEGEDTAWDAPWGRGRPAWHIECSVMGEELLGLGFEIHGGGSDLVFPHHENEAAQTRMGRGAELARIWMHNGMLQLGGEKMAKSVGNIALLPDVLAEHGRDAVVMFFCGGHYRQPQVFGDEPLQQAVQNVRRIREFARGRSRGKSPAALREHTEAFFDALADDFNTPRALAAMNAWMRTAREAEGDVGLDDLHAMLDVLGLANLLEAEEGAPPDVVRMAEERMAARADKDFAEADRLRDAIAAAGWEVRDAPGGASAGGFELVPA